MRSTVPVMAPTQADSLTTGRKVRVLTTLPTPLFEPLRQTFPDLEIRRVPEEGEVPPDAEGEVLLTMTWGSENLADLVARGVRWVHAFGTGIDRFPFEALGDRVLTCSRGASAIPISEWVLAVMLAAEKKLPETWIHERERWELMSLGGLHGRTLALLGIGGIGAAVATRALAFGMRVCALRRSEAPSPIAGVELVTAVLVDAELSDRLVEQTPDDDLGGLFGSVLGPRRGVVVVPVRPSP